MRVIKFRAWDLDNKWMDDHFFIQSNGIAHDVPSRTFDTPNIEIEENPNLLIMQFTGLTDKNGVEIYESDIVSVDYNYIGNKTVRFVDGAFDICRYCISKCEVIGNIHQNKDLLK